MNKNSLLKYHTKYLMERYDCLIVGAGLFGVTFAYMANKVGKQCLVIDKCEHIG